MRLALEIDFDAGSITFHVDGSVLGTLALDPLGSLRSTEIWTAAREIAAIDDLGCSTGGSTSRDPTTSPVVGLRGSAAEPEGRKRPRAGRAVAPGLAAACLTGPLARTASPAGRRAARKPPARPGVGLDWRSPFRDAGRSQ